MEQTPLNLPLEDRAKVLAAYLDGDGRLTLLPRKLCKRLIVLDHVSQVCSNPGSGTRRPR